MEHLPPTGRSVAIEIPYVSDREYDGGDFLSYPERNGWDIAVLREGKWLFNDVPTYHVRILERDDLSSMLQTWLFFGLLQCCLNTTIDFHDFTRTNNEGHTLLTTTRLEHYLALWQQRVQLLPQELQENRFRSMSRYVESAHTIWANLCGLLRYKARLFSTRTFVITETVNFGNGLLLAALRTANRKIFQPGVWYGESTGFMDPLLRKRMLQAGWCPQAVHCTAQCFGCDGQAYAFLLGTTRAGAGHSTCTGTYCYANQISEFFKPKHRTEGCTCSVSTPPLAEIVRILTRGEIPVMKIDHDSSNDSELILRVESMKDHPCFVAISHVWADGLGNPAANAIPSCQLEHIAHALEWTCHSSERGLGSLVTGCIKHVAFWLDTLCIPVDPKYKRLREFSITQMNRIYKQADAVIILDPILEQLSDKSTFAECLARLIGSGWRSRLWTFQEASTTKCRYLIGSGLSIELESLSYAFVKKEMPEEPLQYEMNKALYIQQLRTVGISPNVLENNPDLNYQRFIAAITERMTSRIGDETICIATFLGLDPTPLFQEPAETRMQILLTLLPFIPPNIIFAKGPRLDKCGFRWAPRTLLAPYGVDNEIINAEVNLHSWNSSMAHVISRRPVSRLHPLQIGVITVFPAIRLTPPKTFSSKMLDIMVIDIGEFTFRIPDYGFGLSRDQLRIFLLERKTALIISDFDRDFVTAVALLVEVCEENVRDDTATSLVKWSSDGVTRARTICTGQLKQLRQTADFDPTVSHVHDAGVVYGNLMGPSVWVID